MNRNDLFSYRMGYKEVNNQKKEWDDYTCNKVWNVIYFFLKRIPKEDAKTVYYFIHTEHFNKTANEFEENINYYSSYWNKMFIVELVNNYFDSKFNEKIDLLELIFKLKKANSLKHFKNDFETFEEKINQSFKELGIEYRFIKGKATSITSEEEIKSIDKAIEYSQHIDKAIKLLYDRKNPDFPNSIKESITAVEQICKEITGKTNASLSSCLNQVNKITKLHPAFKEGLNKLYAYTSDEDGIRHAGFGDTKEIPFEEAKFMLVTCSAFVNYLKEKQAYKNEK